MLPQVFRWSATWDEPGHLVSGVNHWRTQDFRLYAVNPPLCRMWATLPVAFLPGYDWPGLADSDVPSMRKEFFLGAHFFSTQPVEALAALRIARLANLAWPLAGTVLMWWVGCQIFGESAGWIAALTWAFCPLVLAHGVLLPPDLAAAVMLLALAVLASRWWQSPTVGSSIALGTIAGIGLLVKTTLIVTLPLILSGGLVANQLSRSNVRVRSLLGGFAVALLLAIVVINLGYGWQGSFSLLGDYEFVSHRLNGASGDQARLGNVYNSHWLGNLPLPLPREFVRGIDAQYYDFERNAFYPYLLGQWKGDGFPLFYVWYFLLKLPTGMLLLAVLGGTGLLFRVIPTYDNHLLFAIASLAVGAFVFLSWRTDLNYCQRYALISFPLICIAAGASWGAFRERNSRSLIAMLVVLNVLTGIYFSPNSLSYYNAITGGPDNGRYLLHGNATDWGQDAFQIGRWCRENPSHRPLSIATVGYPSDLSAYGVLADHLRFESAIGNDLDEPVMGLAAPIVGWHMVSMVHLLDPRSPYHGLRYRRPDDSIGDTHFIFYFDEELAEQFRNGDLPPLPTN